MLQEAIEHIENTAVRAFGANAVEGVGLRNRTLVDHNGELTVYDHDVPARQHVICDLDSLATLVSGHGESQDMSSPAATVWHKGDKVVVVLNDGPGSHRDDVAQWNLSPSKKFHCLLKEAPASRDHKSFIQFAVENLRNEFEAATPGLLGKLRTLKFSFSDDQSGNIQQGRESMGRDIHAAVAGADEFPETVSFRVRRWANLEFVVAVECLLIIYVTNKKISLRPLADELEVAEDEAQAWLHQTITDQVTAPVLYGSP